MNSAPRRQRRESCEQRCLAVHYNTLDTQTACIDLANRRRPLKMAQAATIRARLCRRRRGVFRLHVLYACGIPCYFLAGERDAGKGGREHGEIRFMTPPSMKYLQGANSVR